MLETVKQPLDIAQHLGVFIFHQLFASLFAAFGSSIDRIVTDSSAIQNLIRSGRRTPVKGRRKNSMLGVADQKRIAIGAGRRVNWYATEACSCTQDISDPRSVAAPD